VDILAVGSGEAALKSLAPYVFRVAISNRNLLALQDGHVTFRYRDATTKTTRTATLPAETFIGRFLQHVLPRGLQKVRTYGLLHRSSGAAQALQEHLRPDRPEVVDPPLDPPSAQPASRRPTALRCPHCACAMLHIREIRGRRGPP
jgi:hypothetical protein